MTQPSELYQRQPGYKASSNQPVSHYNRSTVLETARQFDMNRQPNNSSSLPPLLIHRPTLPNTINNNHAHESITSSISSSNGSNNNELIINPRPVGQKRLQSNRKSIANPTTQTNYRTKPQISIARLDSRPPMQQKPTMYRRRTPPPIPPKYRSSI